MKGVVLLFICIALFASIIQAARPVVDTNTNTNNNQQQPSSTGKNPDFFFRWWFWRFPPFHPHPWPISPAPHAAPKFPFPFPGPKGSPKTDELEAAASTLESSSEGTKNPDFFFGWRRFRLWWWRHHNKWSPAPHGAPSKGKGGDVFSDHNLNIAAAVDIEKCWLPLTKIDNCVDDIMGAFSSGNVEIKSACCSAIKKNNCLEKTIGSFNNARFTSAVTDHCSTI